MERLLCLVNCMDTGGAETFLMKLYRQLDRTKYQMDFCIADDKKSFYEDEIRQLGGRIFHITRKTKSPIKFIREESAIIRDEHYSKVFRLGSASFSTVDLWLAAVCGANFRILRSCNASVDGSVWRQFLHYGLRKILMSIVDVKIAPSDLAAEYTFGKDAVRRGEVHFLHNALDLGVYRYSEDSRAKIRREFGLEDKFVVGHVGRLSKQKNHEFLLDVFQKIKEKRSNAVLLLVGKGELQEAVKSKAEALGLADRVIFAGVRADVPALLAAMDVFVFPSFYEGMPNTVIEAQAVGLPCVIADTITKEAQITDLVKYMSLKQSADAWAEQALVDAGKPIDRLVYTEVVRKAGYDIAEVVKEFQKLVFGE